MKKDLFLRSQARDNSDGYAAHQPDQKTCLQVQTTQLAEIGAKLRQNRLQQSISLEQVADFTMIRSSLIQAIEAGQLDELPEPIYIQGLIRRYADALGLNGEQVANSFVVESSLTTPVLQKPGRISLPQLRPWHLYLAYFLLIIISVNGLSHLFNKSGLIEASLSNLNKQKIANRMSESNVMLNDTRLISRSTNDSVTQNTALSTQISDKAVILTVIFKDDSWVEIKIDGKTEFTGTVTKGTQKTWEAKKELVFLAGNAGGVLVSLNRGEVQKLGEPGRVKEVVFTAPTPNSLVNNRRS